MIAVHVFRNVIKALGMLIIALFCGRANAAPSAFTYQGRIVKSDGTPLENNNVSFLFKFTDPSGQCVIYQEQVSGIDMTNSGGVFDVPIGTGSIQFPLSPTTTLLDSFNNNTTFACGTCTLVGSNYTCSNSTSTYSAADGDGRRLRVSFYDGSGWKTISPDNLIRSVPYAGYALSAQKLGTNVATDFLLKAGLPTCTAGTFLSWDGSTLTCASDVGNGGGGGTGTVTNVTGTTPITVATGTSTPVISISQATGTTNGYLSSTDWSIFNGKLSPSLGAANIWVGNAANTATAVAPSGDVTMNSGGAFTVSSLRGTGLSATLPSQAGQLLRFDGTNWTPNFVSMFDLRSTVTGTQAFGGVGCTAGQTLTWTAASDNLSCSNIAIASSQVTFGSQAAGTVFAAPSGGGVPSFRSLTAADLPTGTLSGTGSAGYIPYYATSSTFSNSPLAVSSGNVGIGTASPSTTLEVDGISSFYGNGNYSLGWGNTSASGSLGRLTYSGSDAMILATSGNLAMSANGGGNSQLFLSTTGNVGIGTASPSAILDVVNSTSSYVTSQITAASGQAQLILKGNSDNGSTFAGIYLEDASQNVSGPPKNAWSQAFAKGVSGLVPNGQYFQYWDSSSNVVNLLTLSPAGNVGIGTTSPDINFKLDVTGNTRLGNTSGGGYDTLSVVSTNGVDVRLQAQGNASTGSVGTMSNHDFYILTNDSEKMRITTAGRVGIGTTNPQVSLDLSSKTDSLALPSGTSAQRPTASVSGMIRWNSDTAAAEIYNGSAWSTLGTYTGTGSYSNVSAIGGSSSGLALSAGGTNQNVTLTATGTGVVTTGSVMTVTNATASTAYNNGALVVSGGVGVSGNVNSNGNIYAAGTLTAGNALYSPVIYGGTAAGQSLTLDSTSNASKGSVVLAPSGGNVGVGTATPDARIHVGAAAGNYGAGLGANGGILTSIGLSADGPTYGITIASGGKNSLSNMGWYSNIIGVNTYYDSSTDTLKRYSVNGGFKETQAIAMNSDSAQTGGNRIGFWTGHDSDPVERMSILSTGHVGIGTTNPSAGPLVVNGGIVSSNPTYGINSMGAATTNANSGILFAANNAGPTNSWMYWISPDPTTGSLMMGNGATFTYSNPSITIGGGGSVGIGVAAPTEPLQVGTGLSFASNWPGIGFNVSAANSKYLSSNYAALITQSNSDGKLSFVMAPKGNAGDTASFTTSVVIQPNGYVGIGAGSPVAPLHVGSLNGTQGAIALANATATDIASVSNAAGGQIVFVNGGGGSDYGHRFREVDTGAGLDLRLDRKHASTWYNDVVTFQGGSGFVGIGTATPAVTLDVVGQGRFQSANGQVLSIVGMGAGYADQTNGVATIYSASTASSGGNVLKVGSASKPNTFIVKDNGTVGIGTNNPSAGPLVVAGGLVSMNPTYGIDSSGVATTSANSGIVFSSNTNSSGWMYWISPDPTTGSLMFGTGNTFIYSHPSMTMTPTGAVGIGTTAPSEALEVVGNIRAANFVTTSDRRLKTDLMPLHQGLDIVNSLTGYRFNWISNGKPEYGVMAQEVEKVMPEAVVTNPQTGYKAVKYNALIAPVIEAIKEVYHKWSDDHEVIERQSRDIASLKKENEELKARYDSLEKKVNQISAQQKTSH